MEHEPNHIDNIMHQRLYDAEVPPPAFVWTNLEHELQKRKRRRFFLWLFAFGVAVAGSWAAFGPRETQAPAAIATQQGLTENDIKAAAATGHQIPSETRKPEAPASTAVSPAPTTPVTGNRTAKGSWLQPANDGILPGTGDVKLLDLPAIQLTDNDLMSPPAQPGTVRRDLASLSPLEATALEPLAFSRKSDLLRAKPFIRKKKDPKYCYDFAQNPNVWMVDAYAGPSFSKRKLIATGPAFDAYAQMRRATEQTDWAYNAGLRGSLLLGRHFLVRTGLHYEQMTEIFEYVDPNYVKYIVEITQTIIDNKPVTVIDTVGVEYGENYVKTYNRYGLLDIPIEIGGELRRGRFGLSLNAGMSFNVFFWKRGTVLSPGGQPAPFTPGEKGATDVFRLRTGWSAGASAQLFFHLQPTVRIFAEPYFRQILKPVTLGNQPVEQEYRNWGVKLGMTKILN